MTQQTNYNPSHPYKTDPTPNFFSDYSVVVPAPLKDVYTTFGTSAGHERVCKLSDMCSGFDLLKQDEIRLPVEGFPEGKVLGDVGVRLASAGKAEKKDGEEGAGIRVTRQHFLMEETVPVVFGLLKVKVKLEGTLSWDPDVFDRLQHGSSSSEAASGPIQALYESKTDSGILVWKLRTFEEVTEGDVKKTKVTERIEGWAPSLMKMIVQKQAVVGHQNHMNQYHTLFQ